ncbi:N-acetyl glucosamine related protein [Corynebacterium pseudotuberculosis]|uniref:HAD-IIA family hydrolase n=1 Tax=Corynebacterium pseudotuberculosis TaxID=1719 RepID=UPI000250458E|nr:HAD-IIA family hydrolase [Corynebacterium pseudotuberculosis]AFB72842.1 HAD-IIA family hydrolase [Corynebacterium pseudotuberculosis 316]APQ54577.1 N-acetyl glucosamine related protein [Corynebacterium pseudotuberculosis]APQ56652.1 N-acetyl glucosamine related protein [Corynebacterium pseudotuberculosis]ASC75816.1 HAD-IIA family hydrolase [Corynebacterium pseudotuberculosis]AUY60942.1 N-acetyl glucosamine related protein [Corynebacterium pseudotuberculosis]
MTISYLTDMDGVLIKEGDIIPGADRFLNKLMDNDINFMVLTNNSIHTPRDLSARLRHIGLVIPPERIWTSAKATATFLSSQTGGHGKERTAYVVGESGLTTELHDNGWILTNSHPDFVVLGETRTYSFESITTAINLILEGARFICTNPDVTGPAPQGILPATGAVAQLITAATGKKPYFVGKPNPVMMRSALNNIGAHSENTVMIGDRMDTDVRCGLEAGMRTILVRTGISNDMEISKYPFRPTKVIDSIADLAESFLDPFGDGYYAPDAER